MASPVALPQPWYLAVFLIVWAGCMAYVTTYLCTVVRIRKAKGLGSGGFDDFIHVFFDPETRRYLRWMFSGEHAALGDAAVTRLVRIVRVMFVAMLPAVLLMFALAPWGARPIGTPPG